MSWNNGTIVFDSLCEVILSDELVDKKEIIIRLIETLEDMGWDCYDESNYKDSPIVVEAMNEIYPKYFDEEGH